MLVVVADVEGKHVQGPVVGEGVDTLNFGMNSRASGTISRLRLRVKLNLSRANLSHLDKHVVLCDKMPSNWMNSKRKKSSNEQICHRLSPKRLVNPDIEDNLNNPILNLSFFFVDFGGFYLEFVVSWSLGADNHGPKRVEKRV